jgi:hypothetical protein
MMRAMNPMPWMLAALAALALDAQAATQWSELRKDSAAKLSVDPSSVKRRGDQVSLKYLVDYAKPQGDSLYQVRYLSVVTLATLRCKARTVTLGLSELYSGPGATGVMLASAEPAPKERVFTPIEKGTSDEDLWRHACEKKPAKSAKQAPQSGREAPGK